MRMKFVMTRGLDEIGCSDWDLAIQLVMILYQEGNHFISFKNNGDNTVISDGDNNHLVTVDKKHLFSEDVWAIYGDDGKIKYYTFLLPCEY